MRENEALQFKDFHIRYPGHKFFLLRYYHCKINN